MTEYLTPDELTKLCGKNNGFTCTVIGISVETINERPQMLLHIQEDERPIILTRQLYQDIAAAVGPSKDVEEFFRYNGLQ